MVVKNKIKKSRKTIFVFGNEYLEDDNLALKIANEMKNDFNIVYCGSPELLLNHKEKEINIIDVVKGIEKPVLIEDIKKLNAKNLISLHDFDLAFFLKLMKEMGINKKVKIIGVPAKGDLTGIAKEVEKWI